MSSHFIIHYLEIKIFIFIYMYKLLVILAVLLLGLYFIYYSSDKEPFTIDSSIDSNNNTLDSGSGGKSKMTKNCPDVLIQKGSALFLYNTKRASVPGVNPIRFENLEEYTEFTEWQRSQGILCPILFLQHAYNAQGDPVYKARPSPTNLQGGLPDYYINQPILGNLNPDTNPNIIPPPAAYPVQGFSGGGSLNNTTGALYIDSADNSANISTGNYPGFDPQNQTVGLDTPLDKLYTNAGAVSPNPMDDNWGGVEYTEKLVQAGYYKDNEVSIAVS
jgi:hypothetical protein